MKSPGAVNLIEKLAEERTRDIGSLCVSREGRRVRLPLAGVKIEARVADRVAEVAVRQTFHNPFAEHLEAVYIFPLGGGSAVSAFEMKVGSRTIQGVVKERGQARQDYQKALQDGKRAALLEQERDDVFTVQVGNLPPGEEVSVSITYSERLPFFEDGTTELRLPLVIGERYIPGQPLDRDPVGDGTAPDTDQVPDASRITPPRLAPGFDPKVALGIEVDLAGGALADLACSQHAVKLASGRIVLTRQDEALNRDFVLRWRLAGDRVRSTFLVTKDGCGMLSIVPPKRDGFLGLARDVVFVLDRSGSMGGVKMTSAARACSILLATLGPRDKFSIVAFDDSTEWHGRGFVRADEACIAAGDRFLRTIDARGGTELDPAFHETFEAIRARQETTGRMPVVVLITDGQVGNESAILKRLQQQIGDARVFTVGIDTAVNEAFLKRLAGAGGGTCTCCIPGEALEEALRSVGREIGAPMVTDLRIDGVDNVAPARMPDLFAGRATTVFFVTKDRSVRVRGRLSDGGAFDETVKADEIELPAIAHLWARARVADLEDRFRLGEDVRQQIIDLAVKHTLLTRFTAFVIVDESEIVNKNGGGRKVVQPVEMPDRWEMQKREAEATKCMPMACAMPAPAEEDTMLDLEISQDTAGAGGGIFGQIADKLRGSGGKKFKTAPRFAKAPPPAPKPKQDEGFAGDDKSVPKAEREAVAKAIDALAKALAAARKAVDSGVVPVPEPLEKARQALLAALAASDLGTRLADLQKFLRSTLVELIAALATATVASVRPVLEKAEKEYRTATHKPNFWEATI